MQASHDRSMGWFYDVIEASRTGRMPDNEQIDKIFLCLSQRPAEMSDLSLDGQKFFTYFKDIIETTRLLVKEKNADELCQNFVWHISSTYLNRATTQPDAAQTQGARTTDQAAAPVSDTTRSIRTMITFLFTNSEIRKLFVEASIANQYSSSHMDNARSDIEPTSEAPENNFRKDWLGQYYYRIQKLLLEHQMMEDGATSFAWLHINCKNYLFQGSATNSVIRAPADPTLRRVAVELLTLLERVANGRSLTGIEDACRTLHEDARNDEDFRKWCSDAEALIPRLLLEPGFVVSSACRTQLDQLSLKSHHFFDERYKSHKDALFDAVAGWFGGIVDDPLIKRFSSDWNRLVGVTLLDDHDNLTLKAALWRDIHRVLMPILVDNVGFVPIPRIEYTDSMFNLNIENLTIQGPGLFPSDVTYEYNFDLAPPHGSTSDTGHHQYAFTLSQMQPRILDVAFSFQMKSGLLRLVDSGLANVFFDGKGVSITVRLAPVKNDRWNVFRVDDVKVKIDSLKFSVRDSKHDLLYNIVGPLLTTLVKRQIAKVIKDAITTGCEHINNILVHFRNQRADAKLVDDKSLRKDLLRQMCKHNQDQAVLKNNAQSSGPEYKIVFMHDPAKIRNSQGHSTPKPEAQSWRSNAFSIANTLPTADINRHTDEYLAPP